MSRSEDDADDTRLEDVLFADLILYFRLLLEFLMVGFVLSAVLKAQVTLVSFFWQFSIYTFDIRCS